MNRHALTDLQWLVLPAITNGTYAIADAQLQADGASTPAAVILWARVSPELDSQITANIAEPIRLWPEQWTSGSNLWIVQAVGAQSALQTLIGHVQRGPLAGQVVKFRTQDASGKYIVATMGTGT